MIFFDRFADFHLLVVVNHFPFDINGFVIRAGFTQTPLALFLSEGRSLPKKSSDFLLDFIVILSFLSGHFAKSTLANVFQRRRD